MEKTAVVIINLGTPDSPIKKDVRKFLSEFLDDPFVFDLPYIARKILVNLIIVPFRAGKSTAMYEKIWTKEGSPILVNSKALVEKLNNSKSDSSDYFLAMRYGKLSIEMVFEEIYSKNYTEIKVLPLFPQFASSTIGSVIAKCKEVAKRYKEFPQINFINYFYNHPIFINIWAKRLKLIHYQNFEHIIFVFHGLPIAQVEQFHHKKSCDSFVCTKQITEENKLCYHAQCYDNSRLLASMLNISDLNYTVCFQSRFGKNWLEPFADKVLVEKAKSGIKKILVVPLSFVADCLETKLEIEIDYANLFKANGGLELVMIESLNSGDDWVEALYVLTKE